MPIKKSLETKLSVSTKDKKEKKHSLEKSQNLETGKVRQLISVECIEISILKLSGLFFSRSGASFNSPLTW